MSTDDDRTASVVPSSDNEKSQCTKKMVSVMGEWQGASKIRMWLCNFIMETHPSDTSTMDHVRTSLQYEKDLVTFVAETRSSVKGDNGVNQRKCGICRVNFNNSSGTS